MSDFDSSDLILEQNKPISSAKVLILIDQYVKKYGEKYGKERFKYFLIEKIQENFEEIEFNLTQTQKKETKEQKKKREKEKQEKKDAMINYFSEYYDNITENNDNKFDTSMQKRKDSSFLLLFCKIVVCIIHKKIFINYSGLNDIDDFINIIYYINDNHGDSPPISDSSNIGKYKGRIIKRARKIDKDIQENKIPINKPLKKSVKYPLSDSPDSPVNTIQDTLFNFAPVSSLAAAAPIYGIGEDTFPFKHELLNENMEEDEEDEEDEENDYELSNKGMEMLDEDFRGSPQEFEMLKQTNSDSMDIDLDEIELNLDEIPYKGGKRKTRRVKKSKNKRSKKKKYMKTRGNRISRKIIK